MKSKSGYPYFVNLESYVGYSVNIELNNTLNNTLNNKLYIGTLVWCSNSCICISGANTQLFQWTIPGKVIIDVNRIRAGSIYYSVNGESRSISFM